MKQASAVLEPPARFDPATSVREFRIASLDYCNVIILPRLFELLHARAPRCSLRMLTLERLGTGGGLASDIDIDIGMRPGVPQGCLSAPLFEDEYVCLTRRDPKRRSRRFSLKEYLAAVHVRVSVLDSASDRVDQLLATRDLSRMVALTVAHFSVLPMVVARTGAVATLSRRLADARLTLRAPPLELRTRTLHMIWHQRTDTDQGARFLREVIKEAVGAA